MRAAESRLDRDCRSMSQVSRSRDLGSGAGKHCRVRHLDDTWPGANRLSGLRPPRERALYFSPKCGRTSRRERSRSSRPNLTPMGSSVPEQSVVPARRRCGNGANGRAAAQTSGRARHAQLERVPLARALGPSGNGVRRSLPLKPDQTWLIAPRGIDTARGIDTSPCAGSMQRSHAARGIDAAAQPCSAVTRAVAARRVPFRPAN